MTELLQTILSDLEEIQDDIQFDFGYDNVALQKLKALQNKIETELSNG